jgi:pimeloyl-ACP methyl ester carboxylesterase
VFIPIDDARIFSTAFGSPRAPCIVGIGGWIGNWELWADAFSLLSSTWRTIAYDHRGSGATQCSLDSITFERLVDDVFAVLDAYEIERCVLAGESAGALTVLGAALKHPERITGLVIVDGLTFSEPIGTDDPFLNGLITQYSQTIDRFIAACLPEPNSDHLKRWGRHIFDRTTPEAARVLYRLTGSIDLRADVARLTQPALIIHGSADALVSVEAAQWLVRTLPHAQLTIFEGAGHVPTITRPREVAQVIDAFFAGKL